MQKRPTKDKLPEKLRQASVERKNSLKKTKPKRLSTEELIEIELKDLGDGDISSAHIDLSKIRFATEKDKFLAVMKAMTLRRRRNLKYSVGAWTVLGMSALSNLLLIFLCFQVFNFGELSKIPKQLDFSFQEKGVTMGSPLRMWIPDMVPIFNAKGEEISVENATVFFAPCEMELGAPVADDPLGDMIALFRLQSPNMKNWELTCFGSAEDMDAYVQNNPSNSRLGGFVVTSDVSELKSAGKSAEYDLRFDTKAMGLSEDIISKENHNEDTKVSAFFTSMTLTMQMLFEDTIVGYKTYSAEGASLSVDIMRGPTSDHESYQGTDSQFVMVPIYIIMLVSNLVCEQLVSILSDKEAKFKEALLLAGQPTWTYFITWFFQCLTGLLPYMFVLSLLSSLTIFSNSSAGIVFALFFLSGVAMSCLSIFLSSIFATVTYGSMVGTILLYALSSPAFLLNDPDLPLVIKDIVLLLPPCAITFGVTKLMEAESVVNAPRGILWDTISNTPAGSEDVPFYHVFVFLIVGSCFFLTLAWYLDAVLPDANGKKRPVDFCFSYNFWFDNSGAEDGKKSRAEGIVRKLSTKITSSKSSILDGDDHEDFEKAIPNQPGIVIKDLRKVYGELPPELNTAPDLTRYMIGRTQLASPKVLQTRIEMKEYVESSFFEVFIYLIVFGNLVALMLESEDNSAKMQQMLEELNILFCVVYTGEFLAKIWGLGGRRFFYDPYNCFDFLLLIFGFVEIFLGSASGAGGAKSVKSVKTLKTLKGIRVFRMARFLKYFNVDVEEKSKCVIALAGLNMTAYKNEILSLLGQNGAGKTTFFSLLGGITTPTSGSCLVDGSDVTQSEEKVKAYVGLCPQHDILFDWLSVEDHLRLFAVLKGVSPLDLEGAVADTLKAVGLAAKSKDFVNNLSGGMRRRTSIALACLGDPRVILLDEPSAGVDIVNRQIVWKQLMELKKGRTIIMSTHFMEEAEILGDRVGVLKKGKLQVYGTCVELHTMFGAGYTLVIQRPINPDLMTVDQAVIAQTRMKNVFVKKASDVMNHEDALKICDAATAAWESNTNEEEKPRLIVKVANAAKEVAEARNRDVLQSKCLPDKILAFLQQYVGDIELLNFTEDQSNFEFVLPFEERPKFSAMFKAIDEEKTKFGFTSFGVMAPTLREVFLEISALDDETDITHVKSHYSGAHEVMLEPTHGNLLPQQRGSDQSDASDGEPGSLVKKASVAARRQSRRASITPQARSDMKKARRASIGQGISGGAVNNHNENIDKEDAVALKEVTKREATRRMSARKQSLKALSAAGVQVEQVSDTDDDDEKPKSRQSANSLGISNDDLAALQTQGAGGTKPKKKGRRTSLVAIVGSAAKTSLLSRIPGRRSSTAGGSAAKAAPKKKLAEHSSSQKYRKNKEILWSLSSPDVHIITQLRAMVVKRYLVSKRNRKAMLLEGVLPIVTVLMGVLFFNLSHEKIEREHDPIFVSPGMYDGFKMSVVYDDVSPHAKANTVGYTNPFENYGNELLGKGCAATDSTCLSYYEAVKSETKDDFFYSGDNCIRYDNLYDVECANYTNTEPVFAEFISAGNYVADQGEDAQPWLDNILLYNGSNYWAMPIMVNVLTQSVLAEKLVVTTGGATSLADRSIDVTYRAFPRTDDELKEDNIPSGIQMGAGLLIFMTFASITASHCSDSVAERESGCKRQQLISGVHPVAYWFANFLFDFSFYMAAPFTCVNLVIWGFNVSPYVDFQEQFMLLMLYWGLAAIPFAYVCSFAFAKSGNAQVMMVTLNTIFALIVIFAILFLEDLEIKVVATPIRFIGMMIPHISLGLSLWTFVKEGQLEVEDGTFAGDGMLPSYLLLFEFFIYFTLVIAMENSQDEAAKGYARKKEGTIDEVEHDKCRPTGKTASNMRAMSEDGLFNNIINVMIVMNLCVIFFEMGIEDELSATDEKRRFIESISLFFGIVFIAECMVKVSGFGPIGYLKDPFNIFDGLLVLVSLVDIALMGSGEVGDLKSAKTLKLLKVLRMMRMLRFIRYLKMASYETKLSKSEILHADEDADLRNRASSGKRDSIVKRLSILGGESIEGSAVHQERTRISRRLSHRAANISLKRQSIAGGGGGNFLTFSEQETAKKAAKKKEREDDDAEEHHGEIAGEREDAVAIDNLVKVFEPPGRKPIVATNDVGFGVRQGEIFSLLGPNGAGKSTLLNMMTGSLAPTSGEIYVLDKNISTQFDQVKSRIGFCPQFDALVHLMNSYETLTMFARIKGIPEGDIEPLVHSMIKCIGLERFAHKMSYTYSGGNKRKLSVAIALIANPDLVFLDEPSTGMDPASLTDVYSCVWMWTRNGKHRSIVMTTHSMEEADSLSNRIGIIVNGKLAILGNAQELKSSFGTNYTFEGSVEAGVGMAKRAKKMKALLLGMCPGATDDGSFDAIVRYSMPIENFSLSEVFRVFEENRTELHIKDYTVSQTSLEHVFIHFAQHQR